MIDFGNPQSSTEKPITWYVLRLPGYDYVNSFVDDRAAAEDYMQTLHSKDASAIYEVHGTRKEFTEMQKGLRERKELPSGHVF